MREQLLLYISFDTSLEDVQLLKNEMQAFVNDKENSRDFQPDIDVEITGIAEMNKLELKVEIRHKSNWSNETVRAARRSKFMCALVLALRKVPINAPGGGSAALGSADQPTYSVSVSDQDAAARREEYKKAQDTKRLFPVSKSNLTADKPSRGISTGADSFNPHDSATPPPLRYRQVPPSESTALNTLNSRHPAADTAYNPSDIIEHPTTPKSIAHSVSGTTEIPEPDRSVSIEEVRGMLRRQSTKGKRKSPKSVSYASKLAFMSDANTRPLPPPQNRTDYPDSRPPTSGTINTIQPAAKVELVESPKFEYDPYSYGSLPYSTPQIPPAAQQPPPSRPQPSQAQPSILPTHSLPSLYDQQRPPPPVGLTSAPRQAPAILPPLHSENQPTPPPKNSPPRSKPTDLPLNTTTRPIPPPTATIDTLSPTFPSPMSPNNNDPSSTSSSSAIRSRSPIRNPFQINALKAQQSAGGVGIPRAAVVQQQQQRPISEAESPIIPPGLAAGIGALPTTTRGQSDSLATTPAAPAHPAGSSGAAASASATRRPVVPGAGNSFAIVRDSGVIPPPRGDSLATSSPNPNSNSNSSAGVGVSKAQREWDKVE